MAARSFVRDCSYVRCEQCLGDNLINCRNCVHSYAIKDCEFCRYNQLGTGNKECMDNEFFDGCELQYFACNLHDNYMTALSALIWYCQNTYYSYSCFNSQNLLGSVGLKKGENVIFNIMYSKQEFEELAQRSVQHMQST